MSPSALPTINALLDVSLIDGSSYPSRVEDVDGDVFTVAAPFGVQDAERLEIGALLEIAWLRDETRLGVPARLIGLTTGQPPRWQVQVLGEPRRQTRRAYVRGGGGEAIRVVKIIGDKHPTEARVMDISEGGVRCRIRSGDFESEQSVEVVIELDTERLSINGRVLFCRWNEETADYDLVVTYQTSEAVGRVIRSYILRREMEERRRLSYGSNL